MAWCCQAKTFAPHLLPAAWWPSAPTAGRRSRAQAPAAATATEEARLDAALQYSCHGQVCDIRKLLERICHTCPTHLLDHPCSAFSAPTHHHLASRLPRAAVTATLGGTQPCPLYLACTLSGILPPATLCSVSDAWQQLHV